jgi:hypothetical protein
MVYSANRFLTKEEMTVNAQYIMSYLTSRGWTRNAVAGMLGNMETESTINPGIWQSLQEGNMSGGYGLVQWTPASKYTNWADSRGLPWGGMGSQLQRIEYEVANNIQWISTSSYPLTFSQFKKSTESPEYLASAFITNYERPADPVQPIRSTQARYWYDNLDGSGAPIDGMQLAQFPMDYIYVTQGENGAWSHQGSWAMDFAGRTTQYPYYAPCDCTCIGRNDAEAILEWRSDKEVMCADGQVRQIVWRCIHDDVLDHSVGKKLKKGELMGHTGNGGNSDGDHLHLDVWLGTTFTRTNPLHIYDVFAVNGVEIANSGGYAWRTSDYIDGDSPTLPNNKNKDVIALLLSNALYGWNYRRT